MTATAIDSTTGGKIRRASPLCRITAAMTKSFNIKSKPAAMSAEEFRVLLARKKISNARAAKILSVHRNTISHWINDKHPISLPYKMMIDSLIANL